jgi:2-phosphoglycerate kinase
MIYLLGGPPRVGKSIICSEIQQKQAVSVISTDTLGTVLESVLSPEAAPDNHHRHKTPNRLNKSFVRRR